MWNFPEFAICFEVPSDSLFQSSVQHFSDQTSIYIVASTVQVFVPFLIILPVICYNFHMNCESVFFKWYITIERRNCVRFQKFGISLAIKIRSFKMKAANIKTRNIAVEFLMNVNCINPLASSGFIEWNSKDNKISRSIYQFLYVQLSQFSASIRHIVCSYYQINKLYCLFQQELT